MQTLLTASSLLVLIACVVVYLRSARAADDVFRVSRALQDDRSRITTNERELDALRRELRKLSGKFYAAQRRDEEYEDGDADEQLPSPIHVPVCENWNVAKQLGPRSQEAHCECLYCMTQRENRRRLRAELVPKTVQGQAELARLNAGKP